MYWCWAQFSVQSLGACSRVGRIWHGWEWCDAPLLHSPKLSVYREKIYPWCKLQWPQYRFNKVVASNSSPAGKYQSLAFSNPINHHVLYIGMRKLKKGWQTQVSEIGGTLMCQAHLLQCEISTLQICSYLQEQESTIFCQPGVPFVTGPHCRPQVSTPPS